MRVLWMELKSSKPAISIDISDITSTETRSVIEKSFLEVKHGRKKVILFVFTQPSHSDDSEEFKIRLQRLIDDHARTNEAKSLTKFRKMSRVTKIKLQKLANNPNLKALHHKLVLDGVISEDSFWEAEMKQYELENFEQQAGKSAQPLTYWHDAKTIDLTTEQSKMVFR